MGQTYYGDRAEALEKITRAAGALAKSYFLARDGLEIDTKRSLTDMVSKADREVEDLIRAELHAAFPGDGILGEEQGLEQGETGLVWVVDPIDGTAPFLNGMPGWCISIGLAQRRGDALVPVLGAVYAPVLEEMLIGGQGLPTRLNGAPVAVTTRFDLSTGLFGTGANDKVPPARLGQWQSDLAAAGVATVRYGSGALMLAYVAAGRLVGFGEARMSLWDCLAAYALIAASGGQTLALSVTALEGGSIPVLAATKADFAKCQALCRFDDADWIL